MGFYLLNESMLDSVIYARDKWLKPGGLMLPEQATVYIAPVSMQEFWRRKYHRFLSYFGLDYSSIANKNLEQALSKSYVIEQLAPDQLLSEPVAIFSLDLLTVQKSDLTGWRVSVALPTDREGSFHGITVFFDVTFLQKAVTLSCSPRAAPTHWMQTTLLLPTPDGFQVPAGAEIEVDLSIIRLSDSSRGYELSMAFPE